MARIVKNNPAFEDIVARLRAWNNTHDPFEVPDECIVCNAENRLLTGGVCSDCIVETVDYDMVYNWLERYMVVDNYEEVTPIEGLMLERWLGLQKYDMPSASTRAIKEMLLMEYRRQQAEDTMCGNGFLREVKRYVARDGFEEYAEYIIEIARKEASV